MKILDFVGWLCLSLTIISGVVELAQKTSGA